MNVSIGCMILWPIGMPILLSAVVTIPACVIVVGRVRTPGQSEGTGGVEIEQILEEGEGGLQGGPVLLVGPLVPTTTATTTAVFAAATTATTIAWGRSNGGGEGGGIEPAQIRRQ